MVSWFWLLIAIRSNPRQDGAPLTAGGKVDIWNGSTAAFDTTLDVTLVSAALSEQYGRSVALLPDFTNDSRPELAVGTPWAEAENRPFAGEVRLYYSSPTGLPTQPNPA